MCRTMCHGILRFASRLDRRLLLSSRTLPHRPVGDRFAIALSRTADHARGWLLLAGLGATMQPARASRWLGAGAGVFVVEQLSQMVKPLVRRERPRLSELPALASVTARYSLPSSHTATAFAAIPLFDGLLPRRALAAWAVLTAASRPYLGVHYPSDVAVGALIGAVIGRAFATLGVGGDRGRAR